MSSQGTIVFEEARTALSVAVKPLRIAILGTRGIPANYGGFETFAEELSVRLVQRGHQVTVYCRSHNQRVSTTQYKGVRLVTLPSVYTKHLDTISHSFLSTLHLLGQKVDIAYYCNCANSFMTWMPRLRGARVILNTDGIEWERAKWSTLGKNYLKLSERIASWFPHVLVSDSRVVQQYYEGKFKLKTAYVAYGADVVPRGEGRELLAQVGVEPEEYILFVSRLEPENNAHVLVKAFEGVKTHKKLLVVGSAPFANEYIEGLKSTRDARIIFPGGLYGDVYKALRANAYAYVNAMEVGGTHPAILEAMGAGNCVIVSDIPYNVEAVGDAGIHFRNKSVEDLRERLQWAVDHPAEVRQYGDDAVARIQARYNWEKVVDEYESLFVRTLSI